MLKNNNNSTITDSFLHCEQIMHLQTFFFSFLLVFFISLASSSFFFFGREGGLMVGLKINRVCSYSCFFKPMKHVFPFHAMKQFDVNLLWSQMRQTPGAPAESAACCAHSSPLSCGTRTRRQHSWPAGPRTVHTPTPVTKVR